MLGKHVDEEHYNNRMEKMLLQSQELQKKNQRLFDIASSKNIISNSVYIQLHSFKLILNKY